MKRVGMILKLHLNIWCLILLISVNAYSVCGISGGDGSVDSPYLISDYDELKLMARGDCWSSYNYALDADINASESYSENPIDSINFSGFESIDLFRGELDGKGYVIDSLYINQPDLDSVAFIRVSSNSQIKNIEFTNLSILGNNLVSGLIAQGSGTIILDSINMSGSITGSAYVGSVIGKHSIGNLSLNLVSNEAIINSIFYAGGLIGHVNNSDTLLISNSSNLVSINNSNYTGGLIGNVENSKFVKVSEALIKGSITGVDDYAGGLIGKLDSVDVFVDSLNHINAAITSVDYVGGSVGSIAYGQKVFNYKGHSENTISGANFTAGAFGYMWYVDSIIIKNYIRQGIINSESNSAGVIGNIIAAKYILIDSTQNQGQVNGSYGQNAGIVAYINDSETSLFSNNINSGRVTGKWNSAGIGSYINTDTLGLINNTNRGSISGSDYPAGVVSSIAYVNQLEVSGNSNFSKITSTGNYAAGIVSMLSSGENYNISNNQNSGIIISEDYIGGVIADMGSVDSLTFENNINTGNLYADFTSGGLVGSMREISNSIISNNYNTGMIRSRENYTSGLFGFIDELTNSEFRNNYNTGSIVETYGSGQLLGIGNSTLNTNFENIYLSNSTYLSSIDSTHGTFFNEAELKDSTNYLGFDFDSIWSINQNNSFPYLQGQNNPLVQKKELPNLNIQSTEIYFIDLNDFYYDVDDSISFSLNAISDSGVVLSISNDSLSIVASDSLTIDYLVEIEVQSSFTIRKDTLNIEVRTNDDPLFATTSFDDITVATDFPKISILLSDYFKDVDDSLYYDFKLQPLFADFIITDDTLVITPNDSIKGQATVEVVAYNLKGDSLSSSFDFTLLGCDLAGQGTELNPYAIANFTELQLIGVDGCFADQHFELTNNISAANTRIQLYDPIEIFEGKLNGNGFSIDSLYYSDLYNDSIALFKELKNATIENLNFTNVDINADYYTSVVAAYGTGKLTFNDINISGKVSGDYYVGTLVARLSSYDSISVRNLNVDLDTLISTTYSGGVFGYIVNVPNILLDSVSINTKVMADNYSGGLIGYSSNINNFTLSNSQIVNNITGGDYIGGLIGAGSNIASFSIDSSNVSSHIISQDNIGLVFGYLSSSTGVIDNLSAVGHIVGYYDLGGIIGEVSSSDVSMINSSVSSSIVSTYSSAYVGGAIGYLNTSHFDVNKTAISVMSKNAYDTKGGLIGYSRYSKVNSENLSLFINHELNGSYYLGSLIGRSYADTINTSKTIIHRAFNSRNTFLNTINYKVNTLETYSNVYHVGRGGSNSSITFLTDSLSNVKESYPEFDFENIWKLEPNEPLPTLRSVNNLILPVKPLDTIELQSTDINQVDLGDYFTDFEDPISLNLNTSNAPDIQIGVLGSKISFFTEKIGSFDNTVIVEVNSENAYYLDTLEINVRTLDDKVKQIKNFDYTTVRIDSFRIEYPLSEYFLDPDNSIKYEYDVNDSNLFVSLKSDTLIVDINISDSFIDTVKARVIGAEGDTLSFNIFFQKVYCSLEGDGQENTPFLIGSYSDLKKVHDNSCGTKGYFKLTNDINASASYTDGYYDSLKNIYYGFEPILFFGGVFDGGGYSIDSLYVNRPMNSQKGLFGRIDTLSHLKNLSITNANITAQSSSAILVGAIFADVIIENIKVHGNISGAQYEIGGLVGYASGLDTLIIENSEVDINVETLVYSSDEIGGLVGELSSNVSIFDSNTVSIVLDGYGNDLSGGIGYAKGSRKIHFTNSDIKLNITIDSNSISNPYYGSVGGVVGYNYGTDTLIIKGNSIDLSIDRSDYAYRIGALMGYVGNSKLVEIDNHQGTFEINLGTEFSHVNNNQSYEIAGAIGDKASIENLILKDFDMVINIKVKDHTIYNVGGLFGKSSYSNVNIENINIDLSMDKLGTRLGGVIGYMYYDSIVSIANSNVKVHFGSALNIDRQGTNYNAGIGGVVGEVEQSDSLEIDNNVVGLKLLSNDWAIRVGGAIGFAEYSQKITLSNNIVKSDLNGDSQIGGLFGYMLYVNTLAVYNSISCATITGSLQLGGFIGESYTGQIATFENSYTCGSLNSSSNVGGFIGKLGYQSYIKFTNVYSNTFNGTNNHRYAPFIYSENSNDSVSFLKTYFNKDLTKDSLIKNIEYGLTNSELKSAANLNGWDFEKVWEINEGKGFPGLRSFNDPIQTIKLFDDLDLFENFEDTLSYDLNDYYMDPDDSLKTSILSTNILNTSFNNGKVELTSKEDAFGIGQIGFVAYNENSTLINYFTVNIENFLHTITFTEATDLIIEETDDLAKPIFDFEIENPDLLSLIYTFNEEDDNWLYVEDGKLYANPAITWPKYTRVRNIKLMISDGINNYEMEFKITLVGEDGVPLVIHSNIRDLAFIDGKLLIESNSNWNLKILDLKGKVFEEIKAKGNKSIDLKAKYGNSAIVILFEKLGYPLKIQKVIVN